MSATLEPLKKSFKAQMLEAREQAITASVNRLLSEKGFDAMTVDEVAAEVGIAKASLYKHFNSKEELACAAMVQAIQKAQAYLEDLNAQSAANTGAELEGALTSVALNKLKASTRWTLQLKLAGQMPTFGLMRVSDLLGAWIVQVQKEGFINAALPPITVLYTLYARACDPVVEFLKMSELHSNEEIIEMVMTTCFDGLMVRKNESKLDRHTH